MATAGALKARQLRRKLIASVLIALTVFTLAGVTILVRSAKTVAGTARGVAELRSLSQPLLSGSGVVRGSVRVADLSSLARVPREGNKADSVYIFLGRWNLALVEPSARSGVGLRGVLRSGSLTTEPVVIELLKQRSTTASRAELWLEPGPARIPIDSLPSAR
jgi:hypothetical protein